VIYDVLGREIYTLINNKEFNSGGYKIIWNGIKEGGNKATSGIYFYRLISDQQALTHSMILLK